MRARFLACLVALTAAAGLTFYLGSPGHVGARAGEASPESISVWSRPIVRFRIGSEQTRFGPLEFVGGLEMTSGGDFGGFSSFRFLEPGGRFVGVADTGFWFFGAVVHDEEGHPVGMDGFTMEPIRDPEGNVTGEKWTTDAESIAVQGDLATVGFERQHRISEFRLQPSAMGRAVRDLDFLVPAYELRINRGFETVAYAPVESAFAGARVAIAERSIDKLGNVFAAVLEGPRKGVFTVARTDGFDVTDGAFLPDGDLLLLERRFTMSSGVAMRLRRIEAESIRPGSVADGPVLLTADMGYQIDNMEGLDVWQRSDGAVIVSLMSDDNQSIFQRNLYLEFRLVGD